MGQRMKADHIKIDISAVSIMTSSTLISKLICSILLPFFEVALFIAWWWFPKKIDLFMTVFNDNT